MNAFLSISGRVLIAVLFVGGAAQKILDPAPVQQMIAGIGLPEWFVWPVAAFNAVAAVCLVAGPHIRLWALALAVYCLFTSWFHWQLRADPWQVTIMVKNWAIAGGLLAIAAQNPRTLWRGWQR